MPAAEVSGFAGLCQALSQLDMPEALSVLDTSTGEFLEHRQLCRDPRYKTTWDTSYANELRRLCQGIGSGTTPTSQRVAGTNTFFLIDYHNIPAHKRKEICHTMVVCEVHPKKDDPDRTRITIGGSRICFPVDVGTNTASLELFKVLLNSVLSRKGARFSTIDLKNFYLVSQCPILSMSALKSQTSQLNSLRNTSLQVQTATAGSTSKLAAAAMVFPRPAF
jgi:hypothetical protein